MSPNGQIALPAEFREQDGVQNGEEFDVQRAVLERTRAKLEAMESRLAELERALASRT